MIEVHLRGIDPIKTQCLEFEKNPYLQTILNVRRYDDGGKVPGVKTPDLEHYLDIAQKVLARQPEF